MALIYFMILIKFSSVLCYPCGDEDVVSVANFVPYLIGLVMLLMLMIIIYLCYLLYALKQGLVAANKIKLSDVSKTDGSTQTLNSGITEIKELNESSISIEGNKTPTFIKKPSGPKIPTMQKQQMDNLIKEVLNRKPKSESSAFRELIAMTKRKSIDVWDKATSLRKKSISTNNIDDHIHASRDNIFFKNPIPKIQPDSALESISIDETVTANTNVTEGNNPNIGIYNNVTSPKIDEVYDKVPNPEPTLDNVYDTLPNQVTEHDIYDTIPRLLTNVDDYYDILPNPGNKIVEVYDTVPNKALHSELSKLTLDSDEFYDTLPKPIKCKQDNENDDIQATVPVGDVHSSLKRTNLYAVRDSESDYTVLIADEEHQQNAKYVNANDI